jgi:hypothetical protein
VAAVGVVGLALGFGAAPGASASVSPAPPGILGFSIHHPPEASAGAHDAVEPSIGSSWKTGAAMYQADTTTYRVTFDDGAKPPKATWTDVSSLLTHDVTLDPILFTDPTTGRTFVSQLDLACSLSEFTDDDGASWLPSQGCAQNGSEDHQSVGGGPFHAPLPAPPPPAYPHAVYYCNQDGGGLVIGGGTAAYCAASLDGGTTYGVGHAIYTFAQCGGLHGHVRVGPDGTAVVPNQNCGPAPDPSVAPDVLSGHMFPNQAAVVSTDNGLTWAVRAIPGSTSTLRSDPSVAFDASNRMFFAYEDGVYAHHDVTGKQIGGRAMVATSTDNGVTWSAPVGVGAPFGIQNVTFPEMIAGSPGRAAYAFLGSPTAGDPEDTSFQGSWYLYVAITTDGGTSWAVQNLTPGDPVQRACIFLAGTGNCPSVKRNLFDFMDIAVDRHGRVLIGYADGCTGTCVTDQGQRCSNAQCSTGPTKSTDKLASIARESCGPSLLAEQPAAGASLTPCGGQPVVPGQPLVAGAPRGSMPNTSASPSVHLAPLLVLLPVAIPPVLWLRRRRRRA